MTWDYDSQPKEELTSCNLCGGHRFDTLAVEDRYRLPVTAVRCRACGLVFLNPRMTREAYAAFYRDGHYRELLSQYYGRPITAESIEADQRVYAKSLVDSFGPWLNGREAETLLDVGGSTGVVANALAERFALEATVMEPSKAEGGRALSRGLKLIRGTIEDHEPEGMHYDVILLCQTIDHLTNISGSLRTIRALLAEGGILFVDVAWKSPIKVDHPYQLDAETSADYFRRTGFKTYLVRPSETETHLQYVLGRA